MADILSDLADMKSTNLTFALSQLAKTMKEKDESLDAFFIIMMGVIIYFMQCGFAFLEAGAVRSKNTTNILIKNILDSFIGGLCYYLVGYGLAFGKPGNFFCGSSWFALAYLPDANLHMWFFHFVFAATSATIVSGAVAERCDFRAYLVYSVFITGFVYPIVTHWTWDSTGWLNIGIKITLSDNTTLSSTYMDFAGSGVVHVLGGISSLVAAVILGPRVDFIDPDTGNIRPQPGHSVPLAALGAFILFFGFFAFNGGSQVSISKPGDGAAVSRAVVNTILSASTGAFFVLVLNRCRGHYWSLLETVNGALAGMVSICAGCNVYYPWASCVVGIFAAISYMFWTIIIAKLKIDDPLDAVAVHFGGGLWGVLSVAFLHMDRGIVFRWNRQSGLDLAWQLIGVLAIALWSAILAGIVFGSCKLLRILRVPKEIEIKGLDIPKHGEPAYPLVSYGHGWGDSATADIGCAIHEVPEVVHMSTHKSSKDFHVHINNGLDLTNEKHGVTKPVF